MAFCLCLVAVRKRIYGLRQTQNAISQGQYSDYDNSNQEANDNDGLLREIRTALDDNHPIICAIQAWKDDADYSSRLEDDGHYVVLIGYSKGNDGYLYYFMDPETYELVPIEEKFLGDSFKFVKEDMTCRILSYKGKVFGLEAPNFVELEVTATEPGVKGDTATNVTKPATLETGAEVRVPLFINEGDRIQIDTRSGEYIGRA